MDLAKLRGRLRRSAPIAPPREPSKFEYHLYSLPNGELFAVEKARGAILPGPALVDGFFGRSQGAERHTEKVDLNEIPKSTTKPAYLGILNRSGSVLKGFSFQRWLSQLLERQSEPAGSKLQLWMYDPESFGDGPLELLSVNSEGKPNHELSGAEVDLWKGTWNPHGAKVYVRRKWRGDGIEGGKYAGQFLANGQFIPAFAPGRTSDAEVKRWEQAVKANLERAERSFVSHYGKEANESPKDAYWEP